MPPQRLNDNAFAWAFGMAAIWIPAGVAIRIAAAGGPTSAYEFGYLVGHVLIGPAVAGAIVGASARGSRSQWQWWHYMIATGPIVIAVYLLLVANNLSRGGV